MDERTEQVGNPTSIEGLQRDFRRKFTFFAADNLRGVAGKAVIALNASQQLVDIELPDSLSRFGQKLVIIDELRAYQRHGGSKEDATRLFWKLMLLLCQDTAQIEGGNLFERKIVIYLDSVCTKVLRTVNSSNPTRGRNAHQQRSDTRREVAEEAGEIASEATAFSLGSMFGRWLSARKSDSGNHWWSGWSSGSGSGSSSRGSGGSWWDNLTNW